MNSSTKALLATLGAAGGAVVVAALLLALWRRWRQLVRTPYDAVLDDGVELKMVGVLGVEDSSAGAEWSCALDDSSAGE